MDGDRQILKLNRDAPVASQDAEPPVPFSVYRPGTVVQIGGPHQSTKGGHGVIEARVASVMIAGTNLHVRYLVVWYSGDARIEEWIEADEVISAGPAEDIAIGFTAIGFTS